MFIEHLGPVLGDGDMAVKIQAGFSCSWGQTIKQTRWFQRVLKMLRVLEK